MNTLYYGDNLEILQNREYFPDKCVDLIYLDPPFNSNRNYNVLFKDESGEEAQAQINAFEDTWHWDISAGETYRDLVREGDDVARMIESFRSFIGDNQMMAYLVMMAVRLKELHRVLKQTGSLYLHCDPTASHYLKILLDSIFGPEMFRNEIIWRRTGSHNKIMRFGPIHDDIFFYTKSTQFVWNRPKRPYMRRYVEEGFVKDDKGYRTNYYGNVLTGSGTRGGESGKPWRGFDPTALGRHWAIPGALIDDIEEDISHLGQHEKMDRLLELGFIKIIEGANLPIYERYIKTTDGQAAPDIWSYQPYTEGTLFGTEAGIDADVRWLSTQDKERLGYPTQKPVALLERIIQASSNEGDVVLDPFCGCGTTIAAAQKLNRQWIGIDVTRLAITLQKSRLKTSFKLDARKDYVVIGEPKDLHDARELVTKDNERYQFQWWALGLIAARPLGAASGSKQGKKGSDKGIDGLIPILDDPSGKTKRILVQVKSGKVSSRDIRDLVGTVEREGAAMGVFITLEEPSKDMLREAVSAEVYHSEHFNRDYPKIQILTIEDLFDGKEVKMPGEAVTFKKGRLSTPTTPDQSLPGFE